MRKRLYFLMAVCIGVMSVTGCEKKDEAPPLEKEGYVLDWHDEFDGTELDSSKWLDMSLPHRSECPEEAAKAKYYMKDGVLTLYIDEDTKCVYDGGDTGLRVSGIQTYEKNGLHIGETVTEVEPFNGYITKYGYFETRVKMPSCGGGGHVAWWMVGAEKDTGPDGEGSEQECEIDIFETLFSGTNTGWPKVHPWNDPNMFDWEGPTALDENEDYQNEWHTYAMDWTPDELIFYIDDVEIARTNQSPQYEMCMLFSMYTSDDESFWSGGADNGVYPKEFQIDYVRVYKPLAGYN